MAVAGIAMRPARVKEVISEATWNFLRNVRCSITGFVSGAKSKRPLPQLLPQHSYGKTGRSQLKYFAGERDGNRTHDLLIKSRLLSCPTAYHPLSFCIV